MKTLRDLLSEAKRLIENEFTGLKDFQPGFRFATRGQLAYELVLDASPSMEDDDYPPSRFAAAKSAATRFLQKYREQSPDALIGVVFYARSAKIAAPLVPIHTQYHQVHHAIERGQMDVCTNIGEGLRTAGDELIAKGAGICPVILLLTDGHSNCGPDHVAIASQLKEMGVRLEIIGIGGSPSEVNETQLMRMASVVEGQLRYWFIGDTPELVRKFEALALGKIRKI